MMRVALSQLFFCFITSAITTRNIGLGSSDVLSSKPSIRPKRPTTTPTCPPTGNPSLAPSMSFHPSIKPKLPTKIPTEMAPPVLFVSTPSSSKPSVKPKLPSRIPTRKPIASSRAPTLKPTVKPKSPSRFPAVKTIAPSSAPSVYPSFIPSTDSPSYVPTFIPTEETIIPSSSSPTSNPSESPSTDVPSLATPSCSPTFSPSLCPSLLPSAETPVPSSYSPTYMPSATPSASILLRNPTRSPTNKQSAPIASTDLWTSHGGNGDSDRSVKSSLISSSTFSLANPTHNFSIGNSVYATPAIIGDYVIFPSADEFLYCYSKSSKTLVWKKSVRRHYKFNGVNDIPRSRTTPVRYLTSILVSVVKPAVVLKIDTATGTLLGNVTLDNHPAAKLTMSGTIYRGKYLMGTSSDEEGDAVDSAYQCCSFVGKLVSIDIATMKIVWEWYTIPLSQVGYRQLSGNALWGSSPSVDYNTGIVYIATGNNYAVSPALEACYKTTAPLDVEVSCNMALHPENWFDAVIAINATTGAKVWARRFATNDIWNGACESAPPNSRANCPDLGPDYDFGMCPSLSYYGLSGSKALYISQKSGVTFCLNVSTGSTIWQTQSGPFGGLGGHNWGISVDDTRVYVSQVNNEHRNWTLVNGSVTDGGGWAALDKITGSILWTTSNPAAYDPSGGFNDTNANGRSRLAYGVGPPAAVGDLLLVGSADGVYVNDIPTFGSGGYVYALSKDDGRILSSFSTGASVYGGFSADSRCAFIGYGYRGKGFGLKAQGMIPGKGVYGWCI